MSMIGRVMIESRSIKKIMVYDNGGSAGVGAVHAGEGVRPSTNKTTNKRMDTPVFVHSFIRGWFGGVIVTAL